ncbi:YCF48-related protein [Ideonella sp. A 288]|uniref:WD40/YVTN/BNR-like repeat-containing protein n=1 Tax=Ideonella sp. A 288 TaxID=1962181 RepID=UPI000B4A6F1A|nr:YCF48-related protein [Ideonella sp. A 288]
MQRRTLLQGLAAGAVLPLTGPARPQASAPTAAPAAAPAATRAPAFRDVLDTPARPSPLAQRSLLSGLARAGQRLVAVGQRGHVLTSDDGGQQWLGAEVPVSSDLVAVSFPTTDIGWAVGHDGVVLKSVDGGRRWTRQLDGRGLGAVLVAFYERLGDARWLSEAKRLAAQGAENPWLDVHFQDARNGLLVGAFGLLLRTADGGQTWEPLLHAAENPKGLHLYAVRHIAGEVYIAGEQGLAMKWDATGGRFAAMALPYQGTLFGLVGHERAVLAHGLRGNLLRSTDAGRSWQAVATGVQVGLTASTLDARGRIVVVSQSGHVLISTDDGASFKPLKLPQALPAAAVVSAGPATLAIAGPRGVHTLPLS